ncbi:helix-turn-helix domain-containing protein [Streptomyces pseudogriseolus]|uniref:helix-turn-helix domain-containing protein n=1 Tax=Streptomyces pseudogriseolus TaxID=36817 RepID=UPI003FA27818
MTAARPHGSSAVRMLALVGQHDPARPGPLHSYRPWPAYAVALVVATLDDGRRCSTAPEDVAAYLGMKPATAERHLRQLTKAGWLRRSSDDGWVPAWADDSPTAQGAGTALDGHETAPQGPARATHEPARS